MNVEDNSPELETIRRVNQEYQVNVTPSPSFHVENLRSFNPKPPWFKVP